jgi:hypothetical protein
MPLERVALVPGCAVCETVWLPGGRGALASVAEPTTSLDHIGDTIAPGDRRPGSEGGSTLETMIGIAAILVGAGIAWLCFAIGVYFFTRSGREGARIEQMEDERRQRLTPKE